MTLSDSSITFSEHSSHWTSDDVTSTENDDILSCDGDTSAVDESDGAGGCAGCEERVGCAG